MAGEASLQQMIESLQRLGDLGKAAAPDCAREVSEVLEANINQGVDPYGVVWPLRKKDGQKALQDGDQKLYCAALGDAIVMRLKGPYARHHLGKGTGHVVRKQIPDNPRLPDNIIKAITRALTRHFQLTVTR